MGKRRKKIVSRMNLTELYAQMDDDWMNRLLKAVQGASEGYHATETTTKLFGKTNSSSRKKNLDSLS